MSRARARPRPFAPRPAAVPPGAARTLVAGLVAALLAACSSSDGTSTGAPPPGTAPPVVAGDAGGDLGAPGTPGTVPAADEVAERGEGPASPAPVPAPAPAPPTLDPSVPAGPGPDPADPFGSRLEIDPEPAVAGGAPTAPKHLRVELLSNDWVELNWAPSNDDSAVVEYRVHRSDGHVYRIRGDQSDPRSGSRAEIDKYWSTTSFIDCNRTRFLDALHECADNAPVPGDAFSYQVTAVDDAGQESARSNVVSVSFPARRGAPVPPYRDFYLNGDDRFAQDTDLSRVDGFVGGMELVFEDDFDAGFVDGTKWNTRLTWGDARIINGEQQYFVDTIGDPGFGYWPFRVENSVLSIEAVPTPDALRPNLPGACDEPDPFGVDRCEFLSGALSSHDRFGMTYGFVQGRMKVSGAPGALSSFYLYHRYPGEGARRHAPEIDIVEYLGENPYGAEDAFQTYHHDDVVTGEIRSAPTMRHAKADGGRYADGWHTFGVLWEPQLVIWYVDGVEVRRLTGPQVARQQMNIVTYLVAGSAWAPTPDAAADIFPLTFDIDWIRAWQRPVFVGNGLYPDR